MDARRDEVRRILKSTIPQGRAVAVVGAGLPASLGFPTAEMLLEELKSELRDRGIDDQHSKLREAVQALDNAVIDRGEARRILRDCFLKLAPRQMFDHRHAEIARSFKCVLTTNWDGSFDRVYHSSITPSRIIPCICPKGPRDSRAVEWSISSAGDENTLIKLHGSLTIPESMIASSDDIGFFTKFTVDVGRVPFAQSLDDLLRNNRVFVIAYRLADVDFLAAYMEALKTKAQQHTPDYFVYHSYNDLKARSKIQDWLADQGPIIQQKLKLFPGTLDKFLEMLSEARPLQPDSPDPDPRAQTHWGRPPKASPLVGYAGQAERLVQFVDKPPGTLCVVRGPAHAGLSTFASYALLSAANRVGGSSAYWIEVKNYLPWHFYRFFIERHASPPGNLCTAVPRDERHSPGHKPADAASQVAELLAADRNQKVIVLERLHQCRDDEVAEFFGQLIRAVQKGGHARRVQFIVVLPDEAWVKETPPEFFRTLAQSPAIGVGPELRLGPLPTAIRLNMLLARLGIRQLRACERLLDGFGRDLPIGILVPAAVLLRFFRKDPCYLRDLVRDSAPRPPFDVLLSEVVKCIQEEDKKLKAKGQHRNLHDFMLRCAVFRTPRDEGALRAARGDSKTEPVPLADKLVQYGILSHGPADHRGEATYAMPSEVRRVLEENHANRSLWREWNRQAAALYADQAAHDGIESEEAIELLAVCFHHSGVAGDYTDLIRALERRRRDLIVPWYLPVVKPWLKEADEGVRYA